MYGGLASALLMFACAKGRDRDLSALGRRSTWRVMVPATLLGTYVSLLFWMAGFKYADASVAAALNQTSTLFTFVLAVVILREPVTTRRVAGLVCGIVGVLLVTFFRGAGEGSLG
jgi:drug/metabolite transporter (DMT)-like permease